MNHEISAALEDSSTDALSNAPSRASRPWHTSEVPPSYVTPNRQALRNLNTICCLEDWQNPVLVKAMRRQQPHNMEASSDYPRGFEHRKLWENAQVVVGLEQLGALGSDAIVLSIGAGHEPALYDLTTRVRWLFATDVYGTGQFQSEEATQRMLIDPDLFACCFYNRNRLVVQSMDAVDLRFEDGTFDAVYSLSSVEHFGGVEGARQALREVSRVLKPGGIAAITTECIVNDAPHYSAPGLELFPPKALVDLFWSVPGLLPVEEPVFELSHATSALSAVPQQHATDDAAHGHTQYPHITLQLSGRIFTSFSMFLQRQPHG